MASDQPPALYVDLDGTLIRSNLLYEATSLALRQNPLVLFLLPFWLLLGKARIKEELAARVSPKPELLPYHDEVLEFLRREQTSGRALVLITASPRPWAELVSRHLGLFDGVIATEDGRNLKGHAKLAAIRKRQVGSGSFAYLGDSWADMPVWIESAHIYAVDPSPSMKQRLQRLRKETIVFEEQHLYLPSAFEVLRPQHWIKNLLLFLPAFLAHTLDFASLIAAALGFIAFSGAASATYIVNDLVDIEDDRTHPKKCQRPFASGALPYKYGPMLISALLFICVLTALPLSPLFWAALGAYVLLTTIYSFWLKRKELIDVFSLSSLYTLRILAGAWAVGISVSNWLLGVSIFVFTSLAFAKRAIELHEAPHDEVGLVRGRGYTRGDLPMLKLMGVTSAYAAVVLLALYIDGDKALQLYSHPNILWLICPVFLYWLSRIWVKIHRGLMYHDPVIGAVKDPISIFCGMLIFIIVVVAV